MQRIYTVKSLVDTINKSKLQDNTTHCNIKGRKVVLTAFELLSSGTKFLTNGGKGFVIVYTTLREKEHL